MDTAVAWPRPSNSAPAHLITGGLRGGAQEVEQSRVQITEELLLLLALLLPVLTSHARLPLQSLRLPTDRSTDPACVAQQHVMDYKTNIHVCVLLKTFQRSPPGPCRRDRTCLTSWRL